MAPHLGSNILIWLQFKEGWQVQPLPQVAHCRDGLPHLVQGWLVVSYCQAYKH